MEWLQDVLKGSALFAKQYEKKLPNMTQHSYDNANFHTKHLLKVRLSMPPLKCGK